LLLLKWGVWGVLKTKKIVESVNVKGRVELDSPQRGGEKRKTGNSPLCAAEVVNPLASGNDRVSQLWERH